MILKAISQNREHRHKSIGELLAAIEAAVAAPVGRWETPEDKARRLRPRLHGPRSADDEAIKELVVWAEAADPNDYSAMEWLAITLSALSADTIRWWWERDGDAFTRVFGTFTKRLCGSFEFGYCDGFADFARRAVKVTKDGLVLREAVHGLAHLGEYHHRWHVRDTAVSILQAIRTDEDAVAALEGLRAAGKNAATWTVSDTARRTLHPILRTGLASFLDES